MFIPSHIIEKNIQNNRLLTYREMECFFLSSLGLTSIEIGKKLKISKKTVEWYKCQVIKKLECKNITHAVYAWFMLGNGQNYGGDTI